MRYISPLRVLIAFGFMALVVFLIWRAERALAAQLGDYLALLITSVVVSLKLGIIGRLIVISGLALFVAGLLSRGPVHTYPVGEPAERRYVQVQESAPVVQQLQALWKWVLITYILLIACGMIALLFYLDFSVIASMVGAAHILGWHYHHLPKWTIVPVVGAGVLFIMVIRSIPMIANIQVTPQDLAIFYAYTVYAIIGIFPIILAIYGLWLMISAPFRK